MQKVGVGVHYLYMNDHAISWVAPQYEHHEHGADWYWATSIISISLIIAFIIVGNTLLSIIILVGVGTLLLYSRNPPKNIACELSKKGLQVGDTLYLWDTIESFWILEEKKDGKYARSPKILITSKKTFAPHVIVPLSNDVIQEVHQVLLRMAPEVPQIEPIHDRIMRKVGL